MKLAKVLLSLSALAALSLLPALAHAGVPECGGARVEADASCELRVSFSCEDSCDFDAVVDKCAAELAASCSAECSLDADVSCTADCGSSCELRCAQGDVDCHGGCWDECIPNCEGQCDPGDDQCRSSCESTCDHECDNKCGELSIDATCLEHCNQCCHGMCTATINFDCQIGCQGLSFAGCQQSFLDECEGACGGGGSLFCDGHFISSGDELLGCLDALADLGVEVEINTDEIDLPKFSLCAVEQPDPRSGGLAVLGCLLLIGIGVVRRRG